MAEYYLSPVYLEVLFLTKRPWVNPKESARFSRGGATLVDFKSLQAIGIRQGLEAAFENLSHHTDKIYVHLDMDIVDPVVARSKDFAPTGGLTVEQVVETLHMIKEYFNTRTMQIKKVSCNTTMWSLF